MFKLQHLCDSKIVAQGYSYPVDLCRPTSGCTTKGPRLENYSKRNNVEQSQAPVEVRQGTGEPLFVDGRSTSAAQLKMQQYICNSPQVAVQRARQSMMHQSPVVQRVLNKDQVAKIISKKQERVTLNDFAEHTEISEKTTLEDALGDIALESTELEKYSKDDAIQVNTKLRGHPDTDNKFLFDNYFSEHVWVMGNNFNSSVLGNVFLNEVVNWQANTAGFANKPSFIVRHNIVNKLAREEANNVRKASDGTPVELVTPEGIKFINETDNGRSTVRILKDYGLRPASMQVLGSEGDPTVIIKAEPGEWVLPPSVKKEVSSQAEKLQEDTGSLDSENLTMENTHKEAAKITSPSKNSSKKRNCFLTTACVDARGLPDDCYELTMLRQFRDGYMNCLPDGQAMIDEYYTIAPKIVAAIQVDPDQKVVWADIYNVIAQCIIKIDANNPQHALMLYKSMVQQLANQYVK